LIVLQYQTLQRWPQCWNESRNWNNRPVVNER